MTFYHHPTDQAYEVEYNITGAYVQGRYCLSNGDVGYEDEYPELEVESITLDGRDVTDDVSRELMKEIEGECWKDWKRLNN